MITEPPFDTGATHETTACEFPTVAVTEVGAPGVVAGVTADEFVEPVPVPTAFIANTLKMYEVPFVNPVTV